MRYAMLTGGVATPLAICHYWRAGIHLKRFREVEQAEVPAI